MCYTEVNYNYPEVKRMDLGQRIKQARLEAGLSQRQLCGQEITRNMLSQIENGAAKPSMNTLRYLAAQLGKPVGYFLEEAVASPNQAKMDAARSAFLQNNHRGALESIADFQSPDPIFDVEKHYLEALCCILLAEETGDLTLLQQAAEAGSKTPYYTKELECRRLLCLAQSDPSIAEALPPIDPQLLLLARAALLQGDHARCEKLLDAAQAQSAPAWLQLRGDAAFAAGDFSAAIACYTQIEAMPEIYPKLEQCYFLLGDYKMAYHYACLQRQKSGTVF